MNKSVFKNFIDLYSLTKTLCFELKPVGNTQKMLDENEVFSKDKLIKDKYIKTKLYFNRLHREFIEDALFGITLSDLSDYRTALNNWNKDRKNKEYETCLKVEEKRLREEIVEFFNNKANDWAENRYKHIGLKNKNTEILFEEAVFSILGDRYGKRKDTEIKDEVNNKTVSVFDSWKRFTGYFIKFQETRRNFYKSDGKETAIATRIINQNLKRFCDNLEIYESIRDKVNFSVIEKELSISLKNVFSLEYYNKCLLQVGIDKYNEIVGGRTEKNGEKKKGLNEYINKYKQDNKSERLPFLITLDKQILSEKEKFIDEIEDEKELLVVLRKFYRTSEEKTKILKNLITNFVLANDRYGLEEIYISKEAFNTISQKWTGETEAFEKALYDSMKINKPTGLSYNKKENNYKFPDFIALNYIKKALEQIQTEKFWRERYYKSDNNSNGLFENDSELSWRQFLDIFEYEFASNFERNVQYSIDKERDFKKELEAVDKFEIVLSVKEKERKIIAKAGYEIYKNKLEELLESGDIKITQDIKTIIKNFADQILLIYQMAKYFAVEKKRAWVDLYDLDDVFYNNPENGYLKFYENAYEGIIHAYNHLRNFLTKKLFSEYKWKLNFENPTLADGFDKNKEPDNSTVILRKENRYYLGVMKKGYNHLFSDRNEKKFTFQTGREGYKKMIYKQIANPAFDIHNLAITEKGVQRFTKLKNKEKYWPAEITRIKQEKSYAKENFDRSDFETFIDYVKKCAIGYWPDFKFNFSDTRKYKNIADFTNEIEKSGYKISFIDISENYIVEKNQNGELYLFEIHNKDWNLKDRKIKTGKKNLHTTYFESIFSAENIENNFPIKLNGQAELFFRPRTETDKLDKKLDKKGNKVFDHKRYSENKIFFHCPITLNRCKNNTYQINPKINNFLANNPDINIIGIDRGEKHLVYYSVIKQNGEIIKSGSLNTVNNINYAEKLGEKAKNKEHARKDWQDIEGIKNLKKGYISQVVRKIADLAIENNAIIVFEDLNMRFKQIRGGIEKSIYQQLEKALIEKLNFLVNKNEKNPQKAGNLLKAYQLTSPFKTFKNMGKQTGIIFYTQASYTSKIDPVTGWRPNLYLKYSNAENAKKDILKFLDIKFNQTKNRFEFTYDIKNFKNGEKEYPEKTKWILCSCVERYRWNKRMNNNQGGYEHYINLTDGKVENKDQKSEKIDNFKELFEKYKIDVNKDIKNQIEKIDTNNIKYKKFFEDFIFLFNLICQIRNTNEKVKDENGKDFIFSPVEPFFDSRNLKKFDSNLPQNGDDNGAYNIARKGICILKKISKYYNRNKDCKKITWNDLHVSNSDWDNFTQSNLK